MRNWLAPRCVLVMLLLAGAPAAALGHLLLTWLPGTLRAARLQSRTTQYAAEIEATWTAYLETRAELARLRAVAAEHDAQIAPSCLPQRQSHAVFERLAGAFDDGRVAVRKLSLGQPEEYALVPPNDVVACESITIECCGGYAALTESLDRLATLELPIRFKHVRWAAGQEHLTLTARLVVPFTPDDAMRKELLGETGIEETDEKPPG